MMRAVWIVFVSTIATAILGGLYDYFRPFLADVTKGQPAEAWFTTGSTLYLMPWLFACAGLAGSLIAVAMSGAAVRAGQPSPAKAGSAKRPAPEKKPARGAANTVDTAGMPASDFDAALTEISTAGLVADADAGGGTVPAAPQPSQEVRQ